MSRDKGYAEWVESYGDDAGRDALRLLLGLVAGDAVPLHASRTHKGEKARSWATALDSETRVRP